MVCNKSRFCSGSFVMDFFGPALAVMTTATTMLTEIASLFIFEQYRSAVNKSEFSRTRHTHRHICIAMIFYF